MKNSLGTMLLVAIVSALVTAGTLELLRVAPASERPPVADVPAARPAADPAGRAADSLAAGPHAPQAPPELAARLAELERRLATLELAALSSRAPVTTGAGEPRAPDELRDLVLDWMAEEREARQRSEEDARREEQQEELAFDARFQAFNVAQEHGLEPWQRERLAELFLEVESRRVEIENGFDLATADPEAVEARWVEFDEWAERREREVTLELSPDLYESLYGEDRDARQPR